MRSATVALLAGLVATSAACEDSVQFRLRLAWERGPSQTCPTRPDGVFSCEAIPISCKVHVRVRIIGAESQQVHYSECFTIDSDGDACQLADLPITPRPIPNEMVRVQVIAWSAEELARAGYEPDECPISTEFGDDHLPRLGQSPIDATPEPVPALGGEALFAVGESPVVTVDLGCPAPAMLDAPACRVTYTTLRATIRNPRTFGSILRDDSLNTAVQFGRPDKNGDGAYVVATEQLSPALAKTSSGPLLWEGLVPEVAAGVHCLRVAKSGVQAPTLACFALDAPVAATLDLDGFLVHRLLTRDLLTLLELADVPLPGMVVGVVVDENDQPVSGAVVSTPGGATMIYPSDSLQTAQSTTNSNGLFLSLDAGFESVWHATAPGGLRDDGSARGGLVDDHVSVVVVRLDGVLPPPPDAGTAGPEADAGGDAAGAMAGDAGVDAAGVDAP